METRIAWIGAAVAVAIGACSYAGAEPAAVSPCPAETRSHNADLGRTVLEEVLGRGLIAENEHIYHPQFSAHTRDGGVSREVDRAATEAWRRAFPDMRVRVLHVSADCDLAAVYWEGEGTNTGEGAGLPATGRTIRVQGMTFFEIRDGMIAGEWTVFDRYGMLTQLGLLG
jgi:steroid delta-isomerase-like uncharacterized protein